MVRVRPTSCIADIISCYSMLLLLATNTSSVNVWLYVGLLYAVGGYDGASRNCLSSVECYYSTTHLIAYR